MSWGCEGARCVCTLIANGKITPGAGGVQGNFLEKERGAYDQGQQQLPDRGV